MFISGIKKHNVKKALFVYEFIYFFNVFGLLISTFSSVKYDKTQ